MPISVIIPNFNEQDTIGRCIESAFSARADEVIVCDGGSSDDSVSIAKSYDAKILFAEKNRGAQLLRGANAASGDILVFLHADNWLDPTCIAQVRNSIASSSRKVDCWGGFKQRIESAHPLFRIIEFGNAVRVRYRHLVYGDQAMFVSKHLYDKVGGFRPMPLMEDVVMSDLLAQHQRPSLLAGRVHVCPRRWQNRGIVKVTMENWKNFRRFRRGKSATDLADEYYHD